jgi:chaperonin cofactor prefoldin
VSEEEELELDIELLEREQRRCFERIDEIDEELIVKQERLDEIRSAAKETGNDG